MVDIARPPEVKRRKKIRRIIYGFVALLAIVAVTIGVSRLRPGISMIASPVSSPYWSKVTQAINSRIWMLRFSRRTYEAVGLGWGLASIAWRIAALCASQLSLVPDAACKKITGVPAPPVSLYQRSTPGSAIEGIVSLQPLRARPHVRGMRLIVWKPMPVRCHLAPEMAIMSGYGPAL